MPGAAAVTVVTEVTEEPCKGLIEPAAAAVVTEKQREGLLELGAAAVLVVTEVPVPGEPARLELACAKIKIGVLASPASPPPDAGDSRKSAHPPMSRAHDRASRVMLARQVAGLQTSTAAGHLEAWVASGRDTVLSPGWKPVGGSRFGQMAPRPQSCDGGVW